MCVCNCMHVHSPHMGSVLCMHGSMGINCQMLAPTTFKLFWHICQSTGNQLSCYLTVDLFYIVLASVCPIVQVHACPMTISASMSSYTSVSNLLNHACLLFFPCLVFCTYLMYFTCSYLVFYALSIL